MQSLTFSARSISLSHLLEATTIHRPSLHKVHFLRRCRTFGKCKDAGKVVSCKLVQHITKNKLSPGQDSTLLTFAEPQHYASHNGVAVTLHFGRCRSTRNGLVSSSLGSLLQGRVATALPSSLCNTRGLADMSSQPARKMENSSGGLFSVDKEFKQPKSVLHNFYDILSARLKDQKYRLTQNFKIKTAENSPKTIWNCTYCVKWPLEKCFTAEGVSKADSSTRAAQLALGWLKKAELIDQKGRPILDGMVTASDTARLKDLEVAVVDSGVAAAGERQQVGGCGDATAIGSSWKTVVDRFDGGKSSVGAGGLSEPRQPDSDAGGTLLPQQEAPGKMIMTQPSSEVMGDRKSSEVSSLPKSNIGTDVAVDKPGVRVQQKDAKPSALAHTNGKALSGVDAAVLSIKQPKSTLHNLYVSVANELNNEDYKLQQAFHMVTRSKLRGAKTSWTCTYIVKWPMEARFVGEGDGKADASKHAALQTLSWLRGLGRITRDGLPIIHSAQEVKELKKALPECSINEESTIAIEGLIDNYTQDVKYILEQYRRDDLGMEDDGDDCLLGLPQPQVIKDPNSGKGVLLRNPAELERRSENLYRRLMRWQEDPTEAMLEVERLRSSFPIYKYRAELCRLVAESRVLVVKGEPGCGKSTQLPQFLLDQWTSRRRGAHCNIMITQPRRISAISLAKYVAAQRHEQLGDVVGYQVRLNSVLPRNTGGSLLFCSTGILLQRLRDNPGLLGLSHVVLDEAHERDLNTDTLLVLLRRALLLNPDLHLVVMSATADTELLQQYLGGAKVLHIPGFTHPVKQHFFEDFNIPGLKIKPETFSRPTPVIDADEVAKVICWVDKNRPPGAILCFLPGWAEIKTVMKALQHLNSGFGYVLPLHSRLSDEDQRRIFSTPPLGMRKVILSTNIAETSLTIDDVVYVIDCGAHKEERLSLSKEISSLDNQWVSQANVNQRKGRAGRVKPGESYHLFPRSLFRKMDMFPIPEVLRVSLEKIIVDIKAYNKDDKVEKFLLEMPEPPSREAVHLAVTELTQLGILDLEENLTNLGERILSFTTHPKLSKILVYASIFRCMAPALMIATLLSNDVEMFHGGLEAKEKIRKCKSKYHPSSDHLALAWLYQEWASLVEESMLDPISFCQDNNLNPDKLSLARKLSKLVAEHLVDARMVCNVDTCMDLDAPCNQYARSDEVVTAVLLSGFNTLLQRRSWDISRGRLTKNKNVFLTESGLRATITTESVNTKRTEFSTPFLTYFRQVLSSERRSTLVRETSIVSPIAILLFKPGELYIHQQQTHGLKDHNRRVVLSLKGKRTVAVVCSQRDALLIQELRTVIANVTDYLVRREGTAEQDYEYRAVLMFQDQLLHTLSEFLRTMASDNSDSGDD